MSKAAIKGAVGTMLPHESAHLHVAGAASYVDDMPESSDILHAAVGMSEQAHAGIRAIDLTAVEAAEGVVAVVTAADIPGSNNHGPVHADDPIFAEEVVEYAGQSVFAVVATTTEQARRAVQLARIDYAEREPILDVRTALQQESFVIPSQQITRGEPDKALATAPQRLQGSLHMGGQDHFYLEGQIAVAVPRDDGDMLVYSSTQHPSEVQHMVAHALGKQSKDVVVECRRMGGGFGGKETHPALIACIAALAARKTGRAVKLRLDRDADMLLTGKRHEFVIDYDVGFDAQGRILAITFTHLSGCGRSADLSGAVNGRAMFHSDNCYYLDNVTITSHRLKTHKVSNTAFRGFGGPQGMMGMEYVIDEIARHLDRDPLDVRKINFYGKQERNVTPYLQTIEDNIIHEVVDELEQRAQYRRRRDEIAEFNRANPVLKRGIALTPLKFGIAFTASFFNQAGALVHVYKDGTVMLNHGGTEMGQGLYTKVAQVIAEEFQIDIDQIKCTAADTGKVPNTSATAASSSSDLNGKAAQAAARIIKSRLTKFAAEHYQVDEDRVSFSGGDVVIGDTRIPFAELVFHAYMGRVSLSASGYYRTPKIHYDLKTMTGHPFFYYAYGAAVSEVVIDTLTGEYKLLRADLLHDVGASINPAIDQGQVEGGFLQGVGWLTSEELHWDAAGQLQTHAPSTYKIPTASDWPAQVNVELLSWGKNKEDSIYRSKAVGEPPLMLAISVFHAIKDAVAAAADNRGSPELHAPATPQEVLSSIERLMQQPLHSADKRPCSAG